MHSQQFNTVCSLTWQFKEPGIKKVIFCKDENCCNNDEDYEDDDDVDEDILVNNKGKHISY